MDTIKSPQLVSWDIQFLIYLEGCCNENSIVLYSVSTMVSAELFTCKTCYNHNVYAACYVSGLTLTFIGCNYKECIAGALLYVL